MSNEASRFKNLALATSENLSDIITGMMYKEVTSKKFVGRVLRMIRKELKSDGHFSKAALSVGTSEDGFLAYYITFTAKDGSSLVMGVTTRVAKEADL